MADKVPEPVDVLVIGGGPGGYTAAIRAAQLGREVVLVERGNVGGVCLNEGCIPSKSLINASQYYEASSASLFPGISTHVELDFSQVQNWKKSMVDKMRAGVNFLLSGNGVNVVNGEAFFLESDVVRVTTADGVRRIRFRDCIIATGSRPIELKALPFGKRVISAREALSFEKVPNGLVVVGGGYIGIELGQAFAKFGTKVTVIEATESILPTFDKETVRLVLQNLKRNRVQIFTNH